VDASSLGGGGAKNRQVDGEKAVHTHFPVGKRLAMATRFTYNPEVFMNNACPG
jgi:hypothetical protein